MSAEQKQLLWQACQVLSATGVFDVHGNLSARSDSESTAITINGSTSPRTVDMADFITFDLNDDGYPPGTPAETPLHAEVYRARDDVTAVCHHHSPFAVAVASTGVEMRPVHPNGAVQVAPIVIYDDVNGDDGWLITSDEEGQAIAKLLGEDRVVMLRGHGAVVAGKSVADAVVSSIKLEYNARLLYLEGLFNEPWYLPEPVIEREVERIHSQTLIEKSLGYYLAELR